MAVLAFFVAIGTVPKPAIFAKFDGLEEEFADDGTGGQEAVLLAVLLVDHFVEFVLIPVVHTIFVLVLVSLVGENVAFFGFPGEEKKNHGSQITLPLVGIVTTMTSSVASAIPGHGQVV